MIGKIATGKIEETPEKSGRLLSSKAGAEARKKSLSSEERSQIAKKAAKVRWSRRNP